MTFKPTPVSRAREQVESQLKEAIFSGQFRTGTRLPSEVELAKSFGVSRTTIREALRSLSSSGMITKMPGASGGSFVQVMDHQSLAESLGASMKNTLRFGSIEYEEVAQVRRLLEIPSASFAAENRTDRGLKLLRKVVERQKDTTVEDPEVPNLDVNFHAAIAEASRNKVLASFVTALHQVTRPVLFVELSPEVGKATVAQHSAIVQAIEERNSQAAAEAMEEHLDYLEQLHTTTAPFLKGGTHERVSEPPNEEGEARAEATSSPSTGEHRRGR